MFSYKAYKRFEKVRKSGRMIKQCSENSKLLFVFKESQLLNCWRFEKGYEKIDGNRVHQLWASGSGPIVRHLCSDGRCVNPLHIVRGEDIDNARDEIEVRDFENDLMMSILDDYSMKGEDKALVHLTLLPKVSNKLIEERGINTLYETNRYLREFYRRDYVKRLINSKIEYDRQEVENKLNYLKNRSDVSVITIPDF